MKNRQWLITLALLFMLAVAAWFAFGQWQAQRLNNEGIRLLKEGRMAEAASVLERARANQPRNVMVLKNLGWAYDELGQIDKAREAYQAALALSPSLPDVQRRVAEMAEEGDIRQRIDERLARMKAEGWKDDDVTLERTLQTAEVEFNVGNYKQAIILFERALFKDPRDVELELRIEALEVKVAKGEI